MMAATPKTVGANPFTNAVAAIARSPRMSGSLKSLARPQTPIIRASSLSSAGLFAHHRSFHASSGQRQIRICNIGSSSAPDDPQALWDAGGCETIEKNRCLISVSGKGTFDFLQGLVTNDVRLLEAQHNASEYTSNSSTAASDAFYCAFLNHGGRIIAEAFIYPHPHQKEATNPHVLIDCHRGHRATLLTRLIRCKHDGRRRKDVKIALLPMHEPIGYRRGYIVRHESHAAPEDSWAIWAVWDDEARTLETAKDVTSTAENPSAPRMWRDPRAPGMGWRFLVLPRPSVDGENDLDVNEVAIADAEAKTPPVLAALSRLSIDGPVRRSPCGHYIWHRTLQGIPEGPDEMLTNSSTPFEANVDLADSLDVHKGDFVGRDAVMKMQQAGGVPKRVIPVRLRYLGQRLGKPWASNPGPAPGTPIRAAPRSMGSLRKGKKIGKLLADATHPAAGDLWERELAEDYPTQAEYEALRSSNVHIGLAKLELEHVPDRRPPSPASSDDQNSSTVTLAPPMIMTMEIENTKNEICVFDYVVEALWPDWWPEDVMTPRE